MAEAVKSVVAVNALITYHGKILLMKQNRPEKAKGKWGLPGGKVDVGETFLEALHREIQEEIGLDITSVNVRKLAILQDFPETTCKHLYEVKLDEDIEHFVFNPEEIQAIEWFPLESINVSVTEFRGDWVYHFIQDYNKGVFTDSKIYSLLDR